MKLEEMRRNYALAKLDEHDVPAEPLALFQKWLAEANTTSPGDWFEANAMVVSTSDLEGHVTSRVLLLKGVGEDGLGFYTNYDSEKGRQLSLNNRCSLNFFWPHLERQVRIEGPVSKVDPQLSDKYFRSRPRASQVGATISPQSSRVDDRHQLEQAFEDAEKAFADREVPRPESWGGYRVSPTRYEFWQGRPSRLHDRIVYQVDADGSWERFRIAP